MKKSKESDEAAITVKTGRLMRTLKKRAASDAFLIVHTHTHKIYIRHSIKYVQLYIDSKFRSNETRNDSRGKRTETRD